MYCEYTAKSFALLLNFGQEAVYCNLEIYIHSQLDELLNLIQKEAKIIIIITFSFDEIYLYILSRYLKYNLI